MNTNKRSVVICALLILLSITVFASSKDLPADKTIPAGSKIYVAPDEGFDTFLIAALDKKHVPVTVTSKREAADYEISSVSETEKTTWAKVIFMSQTGSKEEASMKVVNIKTGDIIFAYAVHKRNSVHGKQSSAEACAKHLKEIVR